MEGLYIIGKKRRNDMNNPETRRSRREQKEEIEKSNFFVNFLTNKWVHRILVGTATLTMGLAILLILFKSGETAPKNETDFNQYFPDIDYTITLEEGKDSITGWIVSEELELEDAVVLSEAIRLEKEKDLQLFVFDKALETNSIPDFYEDGLRYDIHTYPDKHFQTRNFYSMPSIDADVESVRDWDINNTESYVDKDNVLHVKGTVPTMASTEETIAFLKGLNGVITDINPQIYENTYYQIKSGLNTFAFSANHPNVIADVELYQSQQVTRGE